MNVLCAQPIVFLLMEQVRSPRLILIIQNKRTKIKNKWRFYV